MVVDCQAGHEGHDTITMDTDIGRLEVYNWEKYKDQSGKYCPGQDDISRTIINTGNWARDETKIIKEVLEQAKDRKHKLVLDFGAHIGWYSIMAAKMGYDVVAFEAQPEHIMLLENNIKLNKMGRRVFVEYKWVDETMPKATLNSGNSTYYKDIWLVKIDLEGNEQYAIKSLENLIKDHKIAHIFMEVSPVFNDSYPNLVNKIIRYGYDAYMDGKKWNGMWNFDQGDILFKRQK